VSEPVTETVAVVVVTYNRAALLTRMLAGLAALDRQPDAVIVVDNASTDHTANVLDAVHDLPLQVIRPEENLGGAGGFHAGVEKAAVTFDLRNPLRIKPKTAMVETTYGDRDRMPALVEIENVPFEGFMVRRRVVEAIGLPDPSFFIFYDDVDYALRARRAGFRIFAVRDAVLVRQLAFDQQHDLGGWKGYYMYRNLFTVHRRYGENALVRVKPWLIAAGVVALSPFRGGRKEARNVVRALRDSRSVAPVAEVRGRPGA
jgi:GT2 family glycosyltransferase